MAINTNTFETTLQGKLDNVTDPKEMLLLGKALESTVGSIAVSDIQDEGTTQTNAVNTAGTTKVGVVNTAGSTQVTAVNNAGTTKINDINSSLSTQLKTVGGNSLVGSGDIAVVPADGSITDAKIAGMSSSKLSGALPAIDGSALTGISSVLLNAVLDLSERTGNGVITAGSNSMTGPVRLKSMPFSINAVPMLWVPGCMSRTFPIMSQRRRLFKLEYVRLYTSEMPRVIIRPRRV